LTENHEKLANIVFFPTLLRQFETGTRFLFDSVR